MRKRLALVLIAALGIVGGVTGSASTANAQGLDICNSTGTVHPLGIHCDFQFFIDT